MMVAANDEKSKMIALVLLLGQSSEYLTLTAL